MSDLIRRQAMINKMRRHRALFCKNRVEFMALPKDEKARVDEIDNCIADLVNAPSVELEERTAKVEDVQVEWGDDEYVNDRMGDMYYYGNCGNCGETVSHNQKYCHYCGARLEWK